MKRVRTGVLWSAIARYGDRGIGLITSLLLMALLSPKDFGLMAAAMVIIGIEELFYDFGISKELVYRRDRLKEAADTSFTMNVSLGLIMFALAVVAAPFLGSMLDLEGLTWIVILTALTLPVSSVGKVSAALLQKNQEFKLLALPTVVAGSAASAFSILAAWLGAGTYSLVLRRLVFAGLESVILYRLAGVRLRLRFERQTGKEIWAYSRSLLCISVIKSVTMQIPPAVLLRMFGAATGGGFSQARNLSTLTKEFSMILGKVLFPSFSERRDDKRAVQDLLLKSTKAIAVAGVPVVLIVAGLGPPVLHLLYGNRWDVAIPFLQVLPLALFIQALTAPAGEACKGLGRPGTLLFYFIVELAVLVASALPFVLWLGPPGVAAAMVLASSIAFLWFSYKATIVIGVDFVRFSASWLSIVALGAVALAASATFHLGQPIRNPWSLLMVEMALAGTVFAGLLVVLEGKFLRSILAGWHLRVGGRS